MFRLIPAQALPVTGTKAALLRCALISTVTSGGGVGCGDRIGLLYFPDNLCRSPAASPSQRWELKRSVDWNAVRIAIGRPTLRIHDLRHTAASIWLAAGAGPKVVQRILGHASAVMTMDRYGHLIDTNLWDAAKQVGDRLGTATTERIKEANGSGS